MPYSQTRDEQILKQFWLDERGLPDWFQHGNDAWTCEWDEFKEFCDKCAAIYCVNERVLVYVEEVGTCANLHISVLRGNEATIEDLREARDDILRHYPMMTGWIDARNRGLRRIVESLGLRHFGVEMRHGWSGGRPIKWLCYSVHRSEIF